jgi:hypothetical protein
VARRQESSIRGGHVVEIERSHEIGGSQVEGPSVGCPKPRGREGRE